MKSLERKILANQFREQIEAILAENGFGTRSVFDYSDLCGLMGAALLAERERNLNGFDIEGVRAALSETYGFASTSPVAQQSINFVLDELDKLGEA